MKIGIIDADLMDNGTRHPNLALMKIAGFHRNKGNDVKLIYASYNEVYDFDEVYISKVFTFTSIPEWVLNIPNVQIGGTGFYMENAKNLPDEIEHHMPYYDLYLDYVNEQLLNGKPRKDFVDYLDFSIGFTTRGCFRKCSFCVNKKYNTAFRHSPVNEFLDENRPAIYLWDDNILAYPKWGEILAELQNTEKPFQFRQGTDLRLMTDEKAFVLNRVKYFGDFIFAFDSINIRDEICDKIQLWKRHSSKISKMYVLCGYDSQDHIDIENTFERIKLLMEYGCLPYIMRHEMYKESEYKGLYIQLARWCNQPSFFKKKSFRQYCEANQAYSGNKEKNCSSYQVMLDFENKHPDIAKKYYDLRFDELNIYSIQYGFGKRYENKTSCKFCKDKFLTWENFLIGNYDVSKFIYEYYFNKINLLCTRYKNSECNKTNIYAEKLFDFLLKVDSDNILQILRAYANNEELIPSNLFKVKIDLETVNFILESLNGNEISRIELLDLYNKQFLKKISESRFINILKIMSVLDLIQFSMNQKKNKIRISPLGEIFSSKTKSEQFIVFKKLYYRYEYAYEITMKIDDEFKIGNK